MPSKINGVETRPVRIAPGSATPRVATGGTAARPDSPAGAADADVQITGAARQLAALEQSIRELPPVNEARVAAVRQRLADGSYSIDPQSIADRLLRMDAELYTER